jgi:hypothetical protein
MSLFDSGVSGGVNSPAKRVGAGSTTTSTPATPPNPAPSVPGPTPTEAPTGSGVDLTAPDPTRFLDELKAQFPWLDDIGIDPKWFQEVAAETGGNADAALVRFRQLPQYKARFPALWRQDGSLRMNESQYLATENAYRQLLKQSGIDDSAYKKPADLATLFEAETDPNELNERLTVYRNIRDGSQAVRDAFYVYAGLDVSVDDLFEATIDQRMAAQLSNKYVEQVSSQNFNYETFINRVTEVAGQRAARLISQSGNTVTISQARNNPERTRQILDVLYSTPGVDDDAAPLSLEELLATYEEAILGAAATGAGLDIPTKERISELRLAGVQRAQAQQAYLEFGIRGGSLSAAGQRTGLGEIDQSRFEEGAFLGSADAVKALQTADAYERAQGARSGSFQFEQGPSGFRQGGLTDL